MENISTISLAVENSIKEIRHYLDEDKGQEDEYIAIVGEGKLLQFTSIQYGIKSNPFEFLSRKTATHQHRRRDIKGV